MLSNFPAHEPPRDGINGLALALARLFEAVLASQWLCSDTSCLLVMGAGSLVLIGARSHWRVHFWNVNLELQR